MIDKHLLMEQLQKATANAVNNDFARGLLEAQRIVTNMPDEETLEQKCVAIIPPELIKELAKTVVGIINDIDWKSAINKYLEQGNSSKLKEQFDGKCPYTDDPCETFNCFACEVEERGGEKI